MIPGTIDRAEREMQLRRVEYEVAKAGTHVRYLTARLRYAHACAKHAEGFRGFTSDTCKQIGRQIAAKRKALAKVTAGLKRLEGAAR